MSDQPRGQGRALALRGITKSYGELRALDSVSLEVVAGRVHALLGENGAGKSTLAKVAFGLVRPDAGEILLDDTPLALRAPADAIAAGIGLVHQHFSLIGAMTVAENVALGGHGRLALREVRERVAAVASAAGLDVDPDARVEDLTVTGQQRAEIVRCLARGARVLILDEPTAVLPPDAASGLLEWLRRFADDGGAVVLITHKLREAIAVADDVTVLRRGRVVLDAHARDVSIDDLRAAMLGAGDAELPAARSATDAGKVAAMQSSEDAVLGLYDADVADLLGVMRLRGATMEVRGGEIVGVAGVEGSGHRELVLALAGRAPLARGRAVHPVVVGFVPEDRHRDAVVLEWPLADNMTLSGAGARRGVLSAAQVRADTTRVIEDFDVRGGSVRTPMRSLSGGNQQRFVIGRELSASPEALVVESPTRGLDLRASEAVRRRLREARDRGAAVVVYSADLDELLELSDRIVVTYAATVREVARNREAIGRAMVGANS